jgi:hypothetical protein
MFDRDYEKTADEWIKDCILWSKGEHPDQEDSNAEETCKYFWEWDGNPPDERYYRPYKDEEATWYQVYENVSEGTPITPPFETKEELIDYLVEVGDDWSRNRGQGGYDRQLAEKFVNELRYVPTMISIGGTIYSGLDTIDKLNKD